MLSGTYTDALVAAGATPVLLPSLDPAHADGVVAAIDGLVITGGGDIDPQRYGAHDTASTGIDPVRDSWELALVDSAQRRGLPVLGICRGCQILNVARGGTLHQHMWGTEEHPELRDAGRLATGHHDVTLTGVLTELYGKDRRRVNSLHHQAIDSVGTGLEVVATASDGHIEAVASPQGPGALGVQWHPERLTDEQPLFEWIATRATAR